MIRHVSVLTLQSGADTAPIEAALATLPSRLRFVAYAFGRDLGINEGNATFAVVADFASRDDYLAYRDDPEHRRILAEVIGPVMTARSAVQYEVAD